MLHSWRSICTVPVRLPLRVIARRDPATSSRRTCHDPSDQPYLGFDGTCAEAHALAEKALRGKLELMMSGADSPMAEMIPKETAHRILHARLVLPGGGVALRRRCADQRSLRRDHQGVAIAVDYPTVAEAESIFAALSEGGKVTMPMSPAFWAKRFGMCTDRFGTPWIVNGEPVQPERASP
mgnify:CR=1 FL=1